jgi:hypothetical protein
LLGKNSSINPTAEARPTSRPIIIIVCLFN